jgi:predicted ribosomally synthesized peptide with SipW-like signal peptide
MKKIIGLTISAILLLALVAGGTYAYFSDTETSNDNTFTAGTLDLVNVISGTGAESTVTEQADGLNDKVVFSLVEPGSSGTITWTLTDIGNVAGTLTIASTLTFGQGGDPTEPEAVAEDGTPVGLDTKLMVWLTRDGTDILGATGGYVAISGLEAILDAESRTMVASPTSTPIVYVLHWQIDTTTGNEIQGDTAEIDITFTLTQS